MLISLYLELMWELSRYLIRYSRTCCLVDCQLTIYETKTCFYENILDVIRLQIKSNPIVSKSERGKENVPGIDVGIEPAG